MPEVVSCCLCGNDSVSPLAKRIHTLNLPEGLGIVECARCGLVFMSPRPTQEEYAKFYTSEPFYSIEAYVRRVEGRRDDFHLRRLAEIEATIGRGRRVLEVGCAAGHFLKLARDRGHVVCGTEISPPLADYAGGVLGLDVRKVAKLADANFPDGFFDLVYSNHVFEHLLDPAATLEEVARILKSRGVLLVEVPNQIYSLRAKLRRWAVSLSCFRGKGALYRDPPSSIHHVFFYSVPVFQQMIRQAGFTILKTRTYQNHHRQVIGDDPLGGYWMTEMLHRASALFGLGPIILVLAQKV
jgi:SAM-dependent methyltransferase